MSSKLDGYYIKKIKENRGKPRLWFEGHEILQAGFAAGQKYEIEMVGKSLILQANPNGTRVVTGKKDNEKTLPVIDLNSDKWLAIFDGMAAVRIVVRPNEIVIVPLASELKKQERYGRLKSKLELGEDLAIGSLYHGAGILSHAIHSGLSRAGISSKMAFINEVREELVNHAAIHNDAWSSDTKVFSAPVQELAFDERGLAHVPKTEIMEMGIPCNAASMAGRAKTGITMPEQNEEVGHLVVGTLIILSKSNPAICLFENVPSYANTASAAILRTQLKDMGYNMHERILNGHDWGSLENRNRWCLMAVTEGIEFSFDNLESSYLKPKNLGELLEKIPDDDSRWSPMQGLKDKEVRDKAAGKGFKMQIINAESESVPTITKGYAKIRSTDPKVAHPNNPNLLRQLTVKEHGDIKGIPYKLLEGATNTMGHEIAGQAVIYSQFEGVSEHTGHYLNRFANKADDHIFNSSSSTLSTSKYFSADILSMANDIGCELKWADKNGHSIGKVIAIGLNECIQDNGRGEGIVHNNKDFPGDIGLYEEFEIKYKNGQCNVIKTAPKLQMSLEV